MKRRKQRAVITRLLAGSFGNTVEMPLRRRFETAHPTPKEMVVNGTVMRKGVDYTVKNGNIVTFKKPQSRTTYLRYEIDLGKPVEEKEVVLKTARNKVATKIARNVEDTVIAVTRKDIDAAAGNLSQSWNCPVALAVKRAFGLDDVSVNTRTVVVYSKTYVLPKSAQGFISRFDTRREVAPFEFRLTPLGDA